MSGEDEDQRRPTSTRRAAKRSLAFFETLHEDEGDDNESSDADGDVDDVHVAYSPLMEQVSMVHC